MSLASGLTWLILGHAFEIHELLTWMENHREIDRDDIQRLLSNEWQILADVACSGAISVRAQERFGHKEVGLGVDELRNFPFVTLGVVTQPFLQLDRFNSTFDEAFKGAALRLEEGFLDPAIDRVGLETYKRSRAQAARNFWNDLSYKKAESWLHDTLVQEQPRTGLKWSFVNEMHTKFRVPTREAERIWTRVAKANGWPLRGRPRISRNENSRSS